MLHGSLWPNDAVVHGADPIVLANRWLTGVSGIEVERGVLVIIPRIGRLLLVAMQMI